MNNIVFYEKYIYYEFDQKIISNEESYLISCPVYVMIRGSTFYISVCEQAIWSELCYLGMAWEPIKKSSFLKAQNGIEFVRKPSKSNGIFLELTIYNQKIISLDELDKHINSIENDFEEIQDNFRNAWRANPSSCVFFADDYYPSGYKYGASLVDVHSQPDKVSSAWLFWCFHHRIANLERTILNAMDEDVTHEILTPEQIQIIHTIHELRKPTSALRGSFDDIELKIR